MAGSARPTVLNRLGAHCASKPIFSVHKMVRRAHPTRLMLLLSGNGPLAAGDGPLDATHKGCMRHKKGTTVA